MAKFIGVAIALLAVIGIISSLLGDAAKQRQEAADAAAEKARVAASHARCVSERASTLDKAQSAMAGNQPARAVTALEPCAALLSGDLEVQTVLKSARVAMHRAIAMDTSNTVDARVDAVFKVQLFDNEEFRRLGPLLESLRKLQQKQRAADMRAEAAMKRKRGVTIGMSQADVLASAWGRPEKVNTTTNAYGVREQWVYGNGNYLYFRDGILTSIQN